MELIGFEVPGELASTEYGPIEDGNIGCTRFQVGARETTR